MWIELLLAGGALVSASATGFGVWRRRRVPAPTSELAPSPPTTVLLVAGDSVVLAGATRLEEGDLTLVLHRTIACARGPYLLWLDAAETELAFLTPLADFPEGAVASAFAHRGRRYELTRRGHARLVARGEDPPLASGDAPYVWLSAQNDLLLVIDAVEGRVALAGARVDRRLVERLS